ncbi:hypothetical protein Esi_0095_0059 [Ectocarpus siliculosus]|uniref:Uncharacterized protein n=1 Tax=Ectocarpus siliculosus TaxID=2880 RepID=D8LU59_ECTSI|nr:hypothetical protein Esi_0095_0059 [Ectocarpus siliculosus]|eukprot:CBN78101.1 hypothetical protein Esi_0095_0059 [Ectocarpus siliculosus]
MRGSPWKAPTDGRGKGLGSIVTRVIREKWSSGEADVVVLRLVSGLRDGEASAALRAVVDYHMTQERADIANAGACIRKEIH